MDIKNINPNQLNPVQARNFATKLLIEKGPEILKGLASGLMQFWTVFIRPFFFSSSKKSVVVPYIYIFICMSLFFFTVGVFLYLSYSAAFVGIKDAVVVLPTLAGVIATLIAIISIMGKTYNEGNTTNTNNNTPPEGGQNG